MPFLLALQYDSDLLETSVSGVELYVKMGEKLGTVKALAGGGECLTVHATTWTALQPQCP